jgi:hypothetical protein
MENFNVKLIVLGILYIIAVLFTVLDFINKYKKAEDSTDKYKYIFLIFVWIITSILFSIFTFRIGING